MMSLPPAAERDQVRAQPLGHRELVGDDLVEQLAAHGEVGVAKPGAVLGQPLGDPVGPAARGTVRPPVVQTLGEAVADRDEAVPGAQRATPSVHLRFAPTQVDDISNITHDRRARQRAQIDRVR